jgi:hypothetical protein
MLPRPELGFRIVDATNTPPGFKTRLISATCIAKELTVCKKYCTPIRELKMGNFLKNVNEI